MLNAVAAQQRRKRLTETGGKEKGNTGPAPVNNDGPTAMSDILLGLADITAKPFLLRSMSCSVPCPAPFHVLLQEVFLTAPSSVLLLVHPPPFPQCVDPLLKEVLSLLEKGRDRWLGLFPSTCSAPCPAASNKTGPHHGRLHWEVLPALLSRRQGIQNCPSESFVSKQCAARSGFQPSPPVLQSKETEYVVPYTIAAAIYCN